MVSRFPLACLVALLTPSLLLGAPHLSLSAPTVRVDRDFRLQLLLSNSSDLYAAGVDLVYDARKLALTDADGTLENGVQPSVREGALLNAAGTISTVRAEALENGLDGRLVIGLTRRGSAAGVSASDQRALVSIGFRALTSGTTPVRLENVFHIDSQTGLPQPVTTSSAVIAVVTAVSNSAPVAVLPAAIGARPGLITLDAAQSSDSDGDPLTYSWSQTGGPGVALSSTSAPAVTFRAVTEGAYTFVLALSDGDATSTSRVTVNVAAATDTPPRVAVVTPARTLRGAATIGYSLIDAEGDPAGVTVEFSIDRGSSFQAATRFFGSESTTGLSASALGQAHSFVWNTGADLAATRQPEVRLRFTPQGVGGVSGSSDAFTVDNLGLGVTARLLEPQEGALSIVGQPIRLRGEAFDLAGAAITNLSYSSSAGGLLGTGAEVTATLGTLGEQTLTLTATDSLNRTGAASVRILVVPAPLPLRFNFAGRVLSEQGAAAPEGSQLVLFNPGREISGSGRVVDRDGAYEATLGSLDRPVAGVGDTVTVEFVDSSGVPRTLTPGGLTLSAFELANQFRRQDFVFTSRTTVALSRGLNLIALPADPGTTSGPYTAAELLDDSQAAFVVRVLAGRFQVFVAGGLVPDFPIRGNEGYLLSMPREASLSFTGRAWPISTRTRSLVRGFNTLGFPAGFPSGFGVGDVLSLVEAELLVEFEPEPGGPSRARVFLRSLGRSSSPLRPGRGYLIRSLTSRSIQLPSAIEQ